MRTKSIFTFLLAVVLCFFGCTKTEYVYIIYDDGTDTSSEETEHNSSDGDIGDGSDDSSSADWGPEDDEYYSVSGDGTRENPYTVPQSIELINSGTYDPDKGYYVKGIVNPNCLAVSDNGAGWNIGYLISDDGDYTQGNYLYVKHGFALGGEYFNSYDDLTAEDNVIVYGRLTNDDGVPEMINGKLYYWNGEFGELDDDEYFVERGDGSKENPYSVSQAVEMIGNGTYNPDKSYYVKGIVSIRIETSTGNIIYYISEEGDFYPETNLFVPSVYGLDGEVLSSEDALSPLDQVIVYGKLSMDSGQPTMYSGKLYYWNGETADVEEEQHIKA